MPNATQTEWRPQEAAFGHRLHRDRAPIGRSAEREARDERRPHGSPIARPASARARRARQLSAAARRRRRRCPASPTHAPREARGRVANSIRTTAEFREVEDRFDVLDGAPSPNGPDGRTPAKQQSTRAPSPGRGGSRGSTEDGGGAETRSSRVQQERVLSHRRPSVAAPTELDRRRGPWVPRRPRRRAARLDRRRRGVDQQRVRATSLPQKKRGLSHDGGATCRGRGRGRPIGS